MAALEDERFMRAALRLARRAVGDTSPNPVVGVVVVRRGRVVGRGYHRRAGLPHAEVEALRRAGTRARGSTLYVTLEPCSHFGRTPPCCDAILGAGVRRVVVGMRDPNPIVNGRGVARLRREGLVVDEGVLQAEAQRLNAPFATFIRERRPWVVAKIAQSLDGKIATRTGRSRWISGPQARRLAHRLRREADAVVVGINTVLRDDPRLTARDAGRPPRAGRPIHVIVDSRLRTPPSARCVGAEPPTIVAATARRADRQRRLQRRGASVLTFPPMRGRVPLRRLLRVLATRHAVMSVLLEGGGELLAGALRERVVDRVVWIVAPIVIGGRSTPSAVGGDGIDRLRQAVTLAAPAVRRLGPDLVIEADVRYPSASG